MTRTFSRPMYRIPAALGAKQIAAGYTANSVHFDGANDYYTLAGGLTISETKAGSAIVRFNTDSIAANQYVWRSSSNRFALVIETTGRMQIKATGSSPNENTLTLALNSATGTIAIDTWYTCLFSWNVGTGTSSFQCYVNGADKFGTGSVAVDDTLRYSNDDLGVWASQAGAGPFDGCVQALAFSTYQMDWSVAANRDAVHDNSSFELTDPGTYAQNWLDGNNAEMLFVGAYDSYTNTGSGADVFTEQSAGVECSK